MIYIMIILMAIVLSSILIESRQNYEKAFDKKQKELNKKQDDTKKTLFDLYTQYIY